MNARANENSHLARASVSSHVSTADAGPRAKHQRKPWEPTRHPVSHRSARSSFREIALAILIPVILVILIRVFVADIYVIPSGSMLDTLQIGDRIVASKIEGEHQPIQRGDIVVFKDPANWLGQEGGLGGSYLVKRVIGLPGDTVSCAGSGDRITINGHSIDETSYLRPGVNPSDFPFSVHVPRGMVFVLGDNRSNSADSRYHFTDSHHGFVPISDIRGVALFTYWPISHWRGLGRDPEVYAGVGGVQSAR
jgi:signal peptidase I